MDSKLIGSNIALFNRYEIIHHTLRMFFNSLDNTAKSRLQKSDIERLTELTQEGSNKIVHRSTREEINNNCLKSMGILIYKLLKLYGELKTERFELFKRRVFKISLINIFFIFINHLAP